MYLHSEFLGRKYIPNIKDLLKIIALHCFFFFLGDVLLLCGFSVRRSNFFLFLVLLSFSFIFIILVGEISYHVIARVRVHNLVVGLFLRIWWPMGINFKIFSKTLNLCLELEVRFPIAIQRFKIMQPNIALICHSVFFFPFLLVSLVV